MSLPQSLYEAYKRIKACDYVMGTRQNEAARLEFQELLNSVQPNSETSDLERGAYKMARNMYHSNKPAWLSYICRGSNNVQALILWTESKHIVRFFHLSNIAYIHWNHEGQRYVVDVYSRPESEQQMSQVEYGTTETAEYSQTDTTNTTDTNNEYNRSNTTSQPTRPPVIRSNIHTNLCVTKSKQNFQSTESTIEDDQFNTTKQKWVDQV